MFIMLLLLCITFPSYWSNWGFVIIWVLPFLYYKERGRGRQRRMVEAMRDSSHLGGVSKVKGRGSWMPTIVMSPWPGQQIWHPRVRAVWGCWLGQRTMGYLSGTALLCRVCQMWLIWGRAAGINSMTGQISGCQTDSRSPVCYTKGRFGGLAKIFWQASNSRWSDWASNWTGLRCKIAIMGRGCQQHSVDWGGQSVLEGQAE